MTPEHYRVREVQREISQMQGALDKERSDLVNRLKANYEAAMREESMLSAAYSKQSAQVAQVGNKSVQYNMLRRDVDSERRLYETLLQRVDEVGLATAMRTSTISVVDPAVPPVVPYSPRQSLNIAVGLFGGSCIGLTFSFLRLRSDRSFHGPGEASYHLQLRELGVIPSVHKRPFSGLFGRALSLTARPSGNLSLRKDSDSSREHNLARGIPAKSTVLAEAFFATMNSLLLSSSKGAPAKVIVLTSPEGGDGKTSVASNLAIALAQIGRRVVLVDGDLRKPRLHQVFDVDPDHGLAKLLEEEDGIEGRPISEIVCTTELPNLFLLPTAVASEGTAAKLHSDRLRILLERLRRDFDLVIIDSPPMLHLSDARVLGSRADGVVLVFRARRTTIDEALAAYECLVEDGIRVLGTVLNDWNARKNSRCGAYSSYMHATS
jgi:capsular exopolysaccharide synthesis family protein